MPSVEALAGLLSAVVGASGAAGAGIYRLMQRKENANLNVLTSWDGLVNQLQEEVARTNADWQRRFNDLEDRHIRDRDFWLRERTRLEERIAHQEEEISTLRQMVDGVIKREVPHPSSNPPQEKI